MMSETRYSAENASALNPTSAAVGMSRSAVIRAPSGGRRALDEAGLVR